MNKTLEQIQKNWQSILAIIGAVVTVFMAGVGFAGWLGIPERVTVLETLGEERARLIQRNRTDIDDFLERFNRYLCLEEADQGKRAALECNE